MCRLWACLHSCLRPPQFASGQRYTPLLRVRYVGCLSTLIDDCMTLRLCLNGHDPPYTFFFFFITLDAGPRRPLRLELSTSTTPTPGIFGTRSSSALPNPVCNPQPAPILIPQALLYNQQQSLAGPRGSRPRETIDTEST
jgi:hypothetical protein